MSLHTRLKNRSYFYWLMREWYVIISIFLLRFKNIFKKRIKPKPRILFYHLTGMAYGGTETFLQLLAKYADKSKYDVYFMFSDKPLETTGVQDYSSRLAWVMDGGVYPIRFDYGKIENRMPYGLSVMTPDIFRVISDFQIDVLVTAGSGHANFPFSAVKNIPIIFVNVFGQPNLQKNIACHLCISQEVAAKLKNFVPKDKIQVAYVPSEEPLPSSAEEGIKLRRTLGIPDGDLVFGRIGRNSDDVYDPIGIEAYKIVQKKYPNIHYLIISPAPILQQKVQDEKIRNVHFLPGSGRTEDLWAFYYAMDILAHFRADGESFGLNIAQVMLCCRPVISHKSRIWNAHLEYLKPEFSRVADVDNSTQYAEFMEFFIKQWQAGKLLEMGEKARQAAIPLVSIERHSKDFEKWLQKCLIKK